jgi:hypothetical protein
VYSKENWQSMAEKEPPFGRVDNLQTSPKGRLAKIFKKFARTHCGKADYMIYTNESCAALTRLCKLAK